ncbi:hypothetical protein BDP27DRAFT_1442736 [Rhodocollybia butyracea]|uniref:F-box domain-containing protein n=1 Tax=Rhodocollybia butyracea TaxID=206335 RepID=A0A9P5Q0T0_9AGAR|nr:hypothetical protein BDP27DRAFT_1442736 [Rhodocollybia butyracea]
MACLPIELVEAILSQLADSKLDLSTCSLVCKQWFLKSRALLFRSFSAGRTPSAPRLSDPFLETIQHVQSIPHLSHLVKKIEVDCHHVIELTRITFHTLKLEHLTQLWLRRNDFSGFDDKISLSRALSSSIHTLILDRVVFKDTCQLLHFLSSPCFSKLRSLSLTDISYIRRSHANPGPIRDAGTIIHSWADATSPRLLAGPKIALVELEIGLISGHNIYDVLYHPDSPFEWNRLRRITFVSIYDNSLIQGFLNGPKPALISLEFVNIKKTYHFVTSGAFIGTFENTSILANITELLLNFDFTDEDCDFLEYIISEFNDSSRLRNVGIALCRMDSDAASVAKAAKVFHKLAGLPTIQCVRLIAPRRARSGWSVHDTMLGDSFYRFLISGLSLKIVLLYTDPEIDREPFSIL